MCVCVYCQQNSCAVVILIEYDYGDNKECESSFVVCSCVCLRARIVKLMSECELPCRASQMTTVYSHYDIIIIMANNTFNRANVCAAESQFEIHE